MDFVAPASLSSPAPSEHRTHPSLRSPALTSLLLLRYGHCWQPLLLKPVTPATLPLRSSSGSPQARLPPCHLPLASRSVTSPPSSLNPHFQTLSECDRFHLWGQLPLLPAPWPGHHHGHRSSSPLLCSESGLAPCFRLSGFPATQGWPLSPAHPPHRWAPRGSTLPQPPGAAPRKGCPSQHAALSLGTFSDPPS